MNLTLKPGLLHSQIEIPGSKSYANRLLILAALRKGPVTLTALPEASDVTHLVLALTELGLKIKSKEGEVTIVDSFPECEKSPREITVGEGGTTARFLACLLLMGKESYTLILGERLKQRPWDELVDLARRYGAKASLHDNKLTLQGPLSLPATIDVDCSRTTQFASGLQLACAFTSTKIIPVKMASSQSYWQMTEHLIQKMASNNEFSIPRDWSSASYPMAYAALNQKIFFPGLHEDLDQADAKLLTLLKSFQCVTETEKGIEVHPLGSSHPVELDVGDCLDLVPTLGYFLSHIEGTHTLSGIENLVHKESDRLQEVISLLQKFHRKAHVKDRRLLIEGKTERMKEIVHLKFPDDHRMVMAGALFLLHHGGGTLGPAEAINKSFPSFFNIISNS
jgi:3-phosphoshikimate 1-carboxyvinyltransferase